MEKHWCSNVSKYNRYDYFNDITWALRRLKLPTKYRMFVEKLIQANNGEIF